MTNGIMNRTSRYFTLSAAIQMPTLNAAATASTMKNGSVKMDQRGAYPYQIISAASIVSEIAKSTILTTTALRGTTSRGKYTFEINPALPMRLFPDSVNAVANNCQGNSAEKTRI